jgi:antitoxin YefM
MSATLPLATVKATLSSVIDDVAGTHERVTITRNGRAAAVLISPDDLAALEETIAVLSDPETLRALRDGVAAVAEGDVVDEAGLLAALTAAGRRKAAS